MSQNTGKIGAGLLQIGILLPHLKIGGIEKNMLILAEGLRKHNVNVNVIFFVQSEQGELLEKARQHFKVIGLGSKGLLGTVIQLRAALKSNAVDILYSATNVTNFISLLTKAMSRNSNSKIVIGEHIPIELFLKTRKYIWFRKALMRILYPFAEGFVAPSEGICREHEALVGKQCPTCTTLPNPVIEKISDIKELNEDVKNIVCVGRLSPEKGMDRAIRSFAYYKRQLGDGHLTIYGNGSEEKRLRELIIKLNCQNSITLAGFIDDMSKVWENADLYLCTSDMEGFGNAIVEAQAAGVPVVSVDCPFGPTTILENGKSGLLIDSFEPELIGIGMLELSQNYEKRARFQREGQKSAGRFLREVSIEKHYAYFLSLLGEVS